MSKSNAEEALAILWFILAALTSGAISGTAIGLGIAGILCAVYHAYVEYKEGKV